MRAMKSVLNNSSIPKWVFASVLNLLVVSGVQAESIGRVYETLSWVQQAIAVAHPSVIEERYRLHDQDRYRDRDRFEQRFNGRNGLIGYTDPCLSRSNRYSDECRYDRSHRRHDHDSRHHRYADDDHHPGKRHGKHKKKHGHGHHHGSHGRCDH